MNNALASSDRWAQICSHAPRPRSTASQTSTALSAPRRNDKISLQGLFTARPNWKDRKHRVEKQKEKVVLKDESGQLGKTMSTLSSTISRILSGQEFRSEEDVPDVYTVADTLAEKLEHLKSLDAQLQHERMDTPLHHEVVQKLARIRKMLVFLRNGGEVPSFFDVRPAAFSGSTFALHVYLFTGGFLITKCNGGQSRRAVYRIRGYVQGGQVELQRLPGAAPMEQDVRNIGMEFADGVIAHPKNIKRHLHVLTPMQLTAWSEHVLEFDVPACEEAIQNALAAERTQNERDRAEKLRLELYAARAPWRDSMKRMRGPLLRELWACLWTVNFARVQSVAMAMRRVGLGMADKIFHEVTVSAHGVADRYFVLLEDAGATVDEAQFQWKETLGSELTTFVRRHAQVTALDAYDCMRGDNAAPTGTLKMRTWLLEHCGTPTRTHWASQFLTRSRGRNMMVTNSFVQRILVDLINEGLAVEVPKVPETMGDLPAWRQEQDAKEAAEAVKFLGKDAVYLPSVPLH